MVAVSVSETIDALNTLKTAFDVDPFCRQDLHKQLGSTWLTSNANKTMYLEMKISR